jgi:hypothetical protein
MEGDKVGLSFWEDNNVVLEGHWLVLMSGLLYKDQD